MRHQAQVSIKLEAAYLCECGQIVDSGDECMCGNSLGLLKLSTVLNRTAQPEIELIGTVPSTERLLPRLRGNST